MRRYIHVPPDVRNALADHGLKEVEWARWVAEHDVEMTPDQLEVAREVGMPYGDYAKLLGDYKRGYSLTPRGIDVAREADAG